MKSEGRLGIRAASKQYSRKGCRTTSHSVVHDEFIEKAVKFMLTQKSILD
jgi:hypothetical protein